MTNFTKTAASQLIYDGPSYMMMNETSNCAIGVEAPIGGFVNAECEEANYTDPAFKRWQLTTNKTQLIDLRPQVRKNRVQSILNCPLNKFIVEELERQCPFYPFTLPPRTSFRAKGVRHEASYKNISASDESFIYNFPSLNKSTQDSML